jgi:hypothetical protein
MAKRFEAREVGGGKYFSLVAKLLEGLAGAGCERDLAGNRQLMYDQYALLLLVYYFSPAIESLRGLQQATQLKKVQKLCGIQPTSLGSLSEAARVFDPQLLEPVIAELTQQALTKSKALDSDQQRALKDLVAVDGSLLKALPRMAWALWQDETHRAAKMHVAFAVVPGVPVNVTVTPGIGAEREQWRKMIQPGGFYVADRGYADFSLFRELNEQGVRFLVRVQENTAYEVLEERPLTPEDQAAGVVRDVTIRRLGTEKHNPLLARPMRIVQTRGTDLDHCWILATNELSLTAELIATAYHSRWQIELFFRWLKCVLGCRHLLSHNRDGVTIQVYMAIIATLLIGLWTEIKPNKRVFELLCLHLSGWADEDEVATLLKKFQKSKPPPSKS